MANIAEGMPGIAPLEVAEQIWQRFETFTSMIAEGTTADDIAAMFVWPEICVLAEGSPALFRGMDEVLPFAREVFAQVGRDVVFGPSSPIISSGDLAWCLAQLTCRFPDKLDETYRISYTWQRRDGEWRAICEVMGNGSL